MNEQQFILRLPQPLVEPMRFALSSNKKREGAGDDRQPSKFQINFKDERNAVFTIDGNNYPASLMDLPCIVETHKTADKRTFYKSGDLHQVLVVRMPDEPAPKHPQLPDGITPATRGAAKRMKQPERVFTRDEVELIERRIKYVIDHKTSFTQKKTQEHPPEEEEVVIEEETVNAAQAAKNAGNANKTSAPTETANAVATGGKPPLPAEAPVAPSPMDVQPSPAADTPGPYTPQPFTPQPFTPTPFTPIDTPGPDGEEDEDDEDDDDDDDDEEDGADNADMADMVDQLMEDKEDVAKKRIERIKLDQSIKEQKAKIADLEAQAEKAPNPILKKRLLSKRPELETELTKLEKRRQELGEE